MLAERKKIITTFLILILFFCQFVGYIYFLDGAYGYFSGGEYGFYYKAFDYSWFILFFLIPTSFIFQPWVAVWADKTTAFWPQILCAVCGLIGCVSLQMGEFTGDVFVVVGLFLVSIFITCFALLYAMMFRVYRQRQGVYMFVTTQLVAILCLTLRIENIYLIVFFFIIALFVIFYLKRMNAFVGTQKLSESRQHVSVVSEIMRVLALRRLRYAFGLFICFIIISSASGMILLNELATTHDHQRHVAQIFGIAYVGGLVCTVVLLKLGINRSRLIVLGYLFSIIGCVLISTVPKSIALQVSVVSSLGSGVLYPLLINEVVCAVSKRNYGLVMASVVLSTILFHAVAGVMVYFVSSVTDVFVYREVFGVIVIIMITQLWVYRRHLMPRCTG